MTDTVASAAVKIEPDFGNFAGKLKSELASALAPSVTQVNSSIKKMEEQFGQLGTKGSEDLKKIGTSASESFRKVETDGSNAFKHIERSGGEMGSKVGESLRKMGEVAGLTFGAVKVAEFFKSAIDAAREAQVANQTTAAAITSTGGAAGVSVGQIDELSKSLGENIGVDHLAIQSGENMLLTFTNIRNVAGKNNDIFDQATKATADMAAMMNHGSVTADGLQSSSIQLGKALSDPVKGITALTRIGVTFDAQQKEQIKTLVAHNDVLGAQKIILAEVNKEAGGRAAAGADPVSRAAVAFKDLKEQIGTALLPIVDKAANGLSTLTGDASKLFSQITSGKGVFGQIEEVVSKFVRSLLPSKSQLSAMESGFRTVVGVIQNGVLPVFEKIASFIANDVIPEVKKVVTTLLSSLMPVLKKWGDEMENHVWPAISKLIDAIKRLWPAVKAIVDVVAELVGWLISHLGPVLLEIAGFIETYVITAVSDFINIVVDIAGHWRDVEQVIFDVLNGITNGAVDAFKMVSNGFITMVNAVLNGAKFMAEGLSHVPLIGGAFGAAVDAISAVQSKMVDLQNTINSMHGTNLQVGISVHEGVVNTLGSNLAGALAQNTVVAGRGAGGYSAPASASGITQDLLDQVQKDLAKATGGGSGGGGAKAPTSGGATGGGAGGGGAGGAAASIKAALAAVKSDLTADVKSLATDTAEQLTTEWKKLVTDVNAAGGKKFDSLINQTKTKLLNLLPARDALAAQVDNAKTSLKNLQQQAKDTAKSLTDTSIGLGDITSAKGVVTIDTFKDQLNAAIAQTNAFADAMSKLTASGLNQTSLQQLAAAGPAQGLAAAQALIQSGQAGVNQVNTLEAQLDVSAKSLGTNTENSMYAAGIKAAQGLASGLESQQAALAKTMVGLADVMINELKKKLKIKSPSQLMADEIGEPAGMGAIQGLLKSTAGMGKASDQVASHLSSGGQGGGKGGLGNVQVVVYLGDREITDIVRVEMHEQTRSLRSRANAGSRSGVPAGTR